MTVQDIGTDFLANNKNNYKTLLKIGKNILSSDMENNQELMNCMMSLISNIAYYEKSLIMINEFEMNNCK